MRNKIGDLVNILFCQMERLNEEDLTPEELEKEIQRSNAMTNVSTQIINAADITLKAKKHLDEYGGKMPDILMISDGGDGK